MSSLPGGHANILCIVPILVYVLLKWAPWMNFFPCRISLSRTSKTMLNRSDDGGHSCLVLDLVLDPFSSVAQSCPTLCNPMDCSTLGLPVHHQLLKFAQTHVHQVGDAIQPSHSLSSPSPTFNLSQHQGLFQWVSSSYQVAKILEFQLPHQSFQWIFRTNFL